MNRIRLLPVFSTIAQWALVICLGIFVSWWLVLGILAAGWISVYLLAKHHDRIRTRRLAPYANANWLVKAYAEARPLKCRRCGKETDRFLPDYKCEACWLKIRRMRRKLVVGVWRRVRCT